MKRFMVLFSILTLPFSSQAGGMSDISYLAIEAAQLELGLGYNDNAIVISQDFIAPEVGADLATVTVLKFSSRQSQKQEWTCVSQFAKTPEFFKIIKTECHH